MSSSWQSKDNNGNRATAVGIASIVLTSTVVTIVAFIGTVFVYIVRGVDLTGNNLLGYMASLETIGDNANAVVQYFRANIFDGIKYLGFIVAGSFLYHMVRGTFRAE